MAVEPDCWLTTLHRRVSGELSLFGGVAPPDERVQPDVADWLVNDIRTAPTTRGLTMMTERQQAIEAIVERPVESLRSLTRAEALRALSSLNSMAAPRTSPTSGWDNRAEDTWIDRL